MFAVYAPCARPYPPRRAALNPTDKTRAGSSRRRAWPTNQRTTLICGRGFKSPPLHHFLSHSAAGTYASGSRPAARGPRQRPVTTPRVERVRISGGLCPRRRALQGLLRSWSWLKVRRVSRGDELLCAIDRGPAMGRWRLSFSSGNQGHRSVSNCGGWLGPQPGTANAPDGSPQPDCGEQRHAAEQRTARSNFTQKSGCRQAIRP